MPCLGGSLSIFLAANVCSSMQTRQKKTEKGIVSTSYIFWSWRKGGGCGLISAVIAVTNESGGDFSMHVYGGGGGGGMEEEAKVDAHS